MAKNAEQPLKLNETELDALARIAKPKLFKYMANISGPYRSRTLIHGGNDYAGLREYSPGDEVRSINWRASARSRQFQVHQHQQEKSGRWFICLDASASMRLPEAGKWRLALQLADAFAYILLISGNQAGFTSFSDKLHDYCLPGSGRMHYKKLHQLLQQLKPRENGGDSLLSACVPQIKHQTSVIVISDFLQADFMMHGLDRLRKAGHHIQVIRVLSKLETQLPDDGLLALADIESGESMLIESSRETRAQAENMLHAQNKELEAYCRQHRIDYSFASSDQYWQTVMLNHLTRI
jgi:uncharacterized protein (DUF58 family)